MAWVNHPDHGTKTLVQEMPVLAAARIIRGQRHATLADGPILRGPTPVQNGPGRGQGRGSGRNRLQAGSQLCHRLHRPRPQAKAVIFVTPGKGCLILLRHFLREHGGDHNNITILPRWSATCRQPSWPPSAKASPTPTSPWTDYI
ncbi:hypothetical protein DFAR_1930010 [Desulfarculales bacterium]